MADELISREAVFDAFRAYMVEHFDKDKCADAENCEVCEKGCLWQKVVASVPAVDAVEVVRCRDCEYGVRCEVEYLLRDALKIENPYCAGGKRRGKDG